MKNINKLIINSPYAEPHQYWEYIRDTREFILQEGRRPAGYVVASESSKSFDDPGIFIEIELVNAIRPRIKNGAKMTTLGLPVLRNGFCNTGKTPKSAKTAGFSFASWKPLRR